jgi:murein DD-endopeptidase MepM/ murein hydrolase activator NlpD
MRVLALSLLSVSLLACSQVDADSVEIGPSTTETPIKVATATHEKGVIVMASTKTDVADVVAAPSTAPSTGPVPIACSGIARQGGLVICKTEPNAKVKIARGEDDFYFENADEAGVLLVGFDRDETTNFVEYAGDRVSFEFSNRDYDTSRIDGLPKNMVNEYTPEELVRIRKASALKKEGFASRAEAIGFKDGFIYPIQTDYTKTTNFGAQRILNGVPKRPHYGVDLAAPKGTPIVAPADGIVSLASDEMYFEGSLIMIDHGQGLISYYLHNEDVLVKDGQAVKQGEQIATVGSKGRSTGPHLCWRLKWRNRNLDPELLTQWPSESSL